MRNGFSLHSSADSEQPKRASMIDEGREMSGLGLISAGRRETAKASKAVKY